MPMHDWTKVIPGIFHHFHHRWISAIADVLNEALLPAGYYALAEQVAEGPIPDVLTLESELPEREVGIAAETRDGSVGGVALAEHPPQVRYILEADDVTYAQKANRVAVFHASGDRVVAYVEIVSPGNKHSESAIRKFLTKLEEALERGCHLLVIDPHPPTRRDPDGLHSRFWIESIGQPESPGVSNDQPLSVMAYRSDIVPNAYFSPVAVGEPLPDMPLFYDTDHYVNVPLERTYLEAWERVPDRWTRVIEESSTE